MTEDRAQKVVEVVERLAAELNPRQSPQVGLGTHLEWDLGLGSIERHELLLRLERELGEKLSSQGVFQASTVADLIAVTPGAVESRERTEVQFEPGVIPPHPGHAVDLIEALLYQAEYQPERSTLFFLEEGEPTCQWTYPDLLAACQKAAAGLDALGIEPGERVGIMLPSGPDYLAAFYGALWVGAVPTPLYPPFRLDQLEDYVLRQSAILKVAGVKTLVGFERAKPIVPLLRLHCPQLERVVTVPELSGPTPSRRSHEHALIQFTSGSTGLPKGVVLSHANLLHNIRGYGYGMNLGPEDVTISWLPLYHDMGLIGTMLGSVYHGQPLALMGPQDFLARPSRWLWAVHRFRGTISPAPNFAYEICASKISDEELEGLDLSTWRVALNGAEAVRPETLARFTERYRPYGFHEGAHFPAYGLAEASLAVTFPPPGRGPVFETLSRDKLESDGVVEACGPEESSLTLVACGRPLPDMEVRIVSETGSLLEEKRRGLVEFRGPSSLVGYFENEEATRAVKDAEGWVKTGDLGFLSEGELYLTGRVKDVIIKAGRNIQAEDVEDMVASVSGVRRGCVAAFASHSEEEGTEILVVVAESRFKEKEEKDSLRRKIEREVSRRLGLPPDVVEIVPPHTVPKTPSGKIRRSECRARWLSGALVPSGGKFSQLRSLIMAGVKSYGERLKTRPRALLRDGWCAAWLAGLLLTPQALSFLSVGLARRSLRTMAKLYLKMAGVHLDVRGVTSDSQPCILVCNHCSTLDPLVLCAVWETPLTFLVAPWVAEHRKLKALVSRLGHIPVHRGDPKVAELQEKEFLARLERGETLVVFPEGGVETTPGLRPFAMGAFQLAARANRSVIPVALQGTRQAQPFPRTVPHPLPVMAVVGPPMRAEGDDWAAHLDLNQRVREWIAEHCGDPVSHRRLRRND